jgi:hypothetical protein
VYEFLADGRPVQLSTSWEPYDVTAGTLVVLPEGGPHAGTGVVNRMAAIGVTVSHAVEQPEPRQATAEEASLLGIQKAALVTHIRRTYYSDEGRPVETADIVVPAAHCEIVYEIPINRQLPSQGDSGFAHQVGSPAMTTSPDHVDSREDLAAFRSLLASQSCRGRKAMGEHGPSELPGRSGRLDG